MTSKLALSTLRINKHLILLGFFALCVSVCTIVLTVVKPANAAPVTGFNAGRIIDDAVFTNSSSMNAAQIQTFLNSKVPTCDTWHAPGYGQNPPFICLKDYSENGRTAAQIIYDTAQQYGINPQVFIVLLQKEQGLVTDTWPLDKQYRTATGYGCPDTAPCDSQYYGLTNQLNWSGKMFRSIMDASPNWYTPYIVGNNFIRWSPNSSCGGSTVNILNRSTQALYNYTPYQPNQAALNAGYGTGDSCSAYGNRNFYQYFKDWFGDTVLSYSWYTTGYKLLNETATQYVDPGFLEPGGRYLVDIAVTNIGQSTWLNSGPTPVRFGTNSPSYLCDQTWIACNRPVSLTEASVAPGQVGHFNYFIVAPTNPGSYREYFKPLAENLTWMNDSPESLGIRVMSPGTFQWYTNGYKLLNEAVTEYVDPGNLKPGKKYYVDIAVTNTGTATWKNSGPIPVRFGIGSPSVFCDQPSWIACNRPVNLREASVAPGQVGHFNYFIVAPTNPGSYREYFKPLAENLTWMNDSPESLGIRVIP